MTRSQVWLDWEEAVKEGRVLPSRRETRRTHKIDTVDCARCGQDHPSTITYYFTIPVRDIQGEWNWYAFCPSTGDPYLVANVDDLTDEAATYLKTEADIREARTAYNDSEGGS